MTTPISTLLHPNRVRYQKHVQVSDQKYSILQLSTKDIDILKERAIISTSSQWYSQINNVPIISCLLKVKEVNGNLNYKRFKSKGYPIVLPCQVTNSGLLCIPREFQDALVNLSWIINESELVGFPAQSALDEEAQSTFQESPLVIAMQRYSSLSEMKLRQLGIPELLDKIHQAFAMQDLKKGSRVRLVMSEIDAKQCGLYNLGHVEIRSENYIRIHVSWEELRECIHNLKQLDDLLYDLIIPGHDYIRKRYEKMAKYFEIPNLSSAYGKKRKNNQTSIIDQKWLIEIIQDTLASYEVSEVTSQTLQGNKDALLHSTVQYLSNLARNGVMSESPRKIIRNFKWGYHLYDKGYGKFRSYHRKVKSVSDTGYLGKRPIIFLWVVIFFGAFIPILYILIRVDSGLSFEQLTSTAFNLFGFYLTFASFFLLQVAYKGERLPEMLISLRNIDTQAEFDAYPNRQIPDIIEVIRMSVKPPQFFGGENMNYLDVGPYEEGLNPENEIQFSNLDLIGFALYETEKGELYMRDKWLNLFKVAIGKKQGNVHGKSSETGANNSVSLKKKSNNVENIPSLDNLSLYSQIVDNTISSKVSDKGRSIQVTYECSGERNTVTLYRLLPYGSNHRVFQERTWRLLDSKSTRKNFNNKDIFRMSIGQGLNDDDAAIH